MYITPLQSPQFSGRTKFLSCDAGGKYKKIAKYLYGSSSFGDTRGLQVLVKKYSYPYAKVEETIGKFHNDITYKIYYADPKEVVDNGIKHSHDYIVYDNEPLFPDLRKKFFSPQYGNLDNEFKVVYDYFKRMEGVVTKKSDVDFARKNQVLADSCRKIFEESADLRKEQEAIINDILSKEEKIEQIKVNVKDYETKSAKKRETIPMHKKTLEAKMRKLSRYRDKFSLLQNKGDNSDEIRIVQANIERYEAECKALAEKIKKYEERLVYWENYIKNAPQEISDITECISKKRTILDGVEGLIQLNYYKLCKFYKENGIRVS
jgi:predicted  nucleic acid-binding Zn-ribbon protein